MHEVAARDTYGCSLDLQAAGGARSLAVSNFSPAQLDAILKEPCVRLQPYAPQAATLCIPARNPMYPSLQASMSAVTPRRVRLWARLANSAWPGLEIRVGVGVG